MRELPCIIQAVGSKHKPVSQLKHRSYW